MAVDEEFAFNVSVPHEARIYDYWLGGKDNWPADRAAADAIMQRFPAAAVNCRNNRAFLRRVVGHLASSGVRQFIDIGSGLPTAENTHQVAQAVDPACVVAYVDYDTVVVRHAQALLAAPGVITVQGDLRRPGELLKDPDLAGLIDLSEPVGVLAMAVLHFLPGDEAHDAVRVITGALAPGSALGLSHVTPDHVSDPDAAQAAVDVYRDASISLTPRSHAEVAQFFDGLELAEPGVVDVTAWHPAEPAPLASVYGGVGWRRAGAGRP